METRYDSYYEKEIPYKMSLEELLAIDYKRAEDFLAYFRYIGIENVRVIVPATAQRNIHKSPFLGVAMCSGDRVDTICKMVNNENDLYNPLIEKGCLIHPGHWYHAYKIEFTPVEYEGVIERFYMTDFCAMLNSGRAKIVRTLPLAIEQAQIEETQRLYDNNICLICYTQHNSKQEMLNCDCIEHKLL